MHEDLGAWGWLMWVLMPLMWLGLPALFGWIVWLPAGTQPNTAASFDLLKETS